MVAAGFSTYRRPPRRVRVAPGGVSGWPMVTALAGRARADRADFAVCGLNGFRLRRPMSTRSTSLVFAEAAVLAASVALAVITSTTEQWQPPALVAVILVLALATDLFAVSHHGQRISGSFLALVLAMALLGPAPAAAIGIASVLFDQMRARNPGPLLLANLAAFATLPARRRPAHRRRRRRPRVRRVRAARDRRLPAHEPPELPDDRRPPRVRHARVARGRVPQDLRPGPAERDPQRHPVRARRQRLRAHGRRRDRADAARAARLPVPAARAAAARASERSGSRRCSSACS